MGPRLGSRGKSVLNRFNGKDISLQWGRDLEVAESESSLVLPQAILLASMGPRLGSRGKMDRMVSLCVGPCASMGPRLGSRGKDRGGSRKGKVLVLQWGRDLEVAESVLISLGVRSFPTGFNGAATWKSRKGSRDRSRHSCLTSFNGAATWKSRKVGQSNRVTLMPSSFNGAATWKSRKGPRRNRGPCKKISFNGAATWKSRKGSGRRSHQFELRSFNGAATWKSRKEFRHLEPLANWMQASMGPRLGSRGKTMYNVFPEPRIRASMGPRLGSRGKRPFLPFIHSCTSMLQWGRDLEVAES